MRLLWSLPKAAPALLRHLTAYLELIEHDLAQARREAAASIAAVVILVLCVFFALLIGCIAVLALTWDTPHRLAAIAWMGGAFLGMAVAVTAYLAGRRDRPPFLDSVRREWQEDRVILERILSDEQ